MRNRPSARRALIAAAFVLPLATAADARAAGLFDAIGAIFGADPEPPSHYRQAPRGPHYGEGGGLDITVRPRRHRPKRERPVVRKESPAPVAAIDLDPAKNPGWYLLDPTLKRGDIVVLKGEVLIFEGSGRGPHLREDFTSLAQSDLSGTERGRIAAMARLRPNEARAAEQKTATARAE